MGLFDHLFKSKTDLANEEHVEGAPAAEDAPSIGGAVNVPAPKPPPIAPPTAFAPRSLGQVVTPGRAGPPQRSGSAERRTGAGDAEEKTVAREIILTLDDVLARIPKELLIESAHDGRRALRFPVDALSADIARGRAAVPLSQIAAQCPDIFCVPIDEDNDVLVRLPLQKLVEQIAPGGISATLSRQPAADAKIHLSIAAILRTCPREIILGELPPVAETERIVFPFAPIERQLPSGRVDVSSIRFVAALPLHMHEYFRALEGVRVPLPLDEIFQNLPGLPSAAPSVAPIPASAPVAAPAAVPPLESPAAFAPAPVVPPEPLPVFEPAPNAALSPESESAPLPAAAFVSPPASVSEPVPVLVSEPISSPASEPSPAPMETPVSVEVSASVEAPVSVEVPGVLPAPAAGPLFAPEPASVPAPVFPPPAEEPPLAEPVAVPAAPSPPAPNVDLAKDEIAELRARIAALKVEFDVSSIALGLSPAAVPPQVVPSPVMPPPVEAPPLAAVSATEPISPQLASQSLFVPAPGPRPGVPPSFGVERAPSGPPPVSMSARSPAPAPEPAAEPAPELVAAPVPVSAPMPELFRPPLVPPPLEPVIVPVVPKIEPPAPVMLPVRIVAPPPMRPHVAPPPLFSAGANIVLPDVHAPAPVAAPEPPAPPPPPLVLERAGTVLGIEGTPTLAGVAEQLTTLPGLAACVLDVRHETADAGSLPAGLDSAAIRTLVAPLATALAGREGEHITLFGEHGSISVFTRGVARLAVLHRARVFLPGVRERLAATVEALAEA